MIFSLDINVLFPQNKKSRLKQTPTRSETVALGDLTRAWQPLYPHSTHTEIHTQHVLRV